MTPGQGQTVNIAGIKVGDLTEVELEDGNAVVTMAIDNEYAPLIHEDATMLLRPRTGLQDMMIELDPGTEGEPVPEGTTIPVSQTQPNVQPDQILQTLDGDTRAYLRLLLQAAGNGLGGRGEELSAGPAPLRAAGARPRRHRRGAGRAAREHQPLDHQLQAGQRGARRQPAGRVRRIRRATALGSFANQEAAIRESLQELPEHPALDPLGARGERDVRQRARARARAT